MLKALRRIVQKVNATKDIGEALSIVVRLVKENTSADACSIFIVDPERGDYVLAATEGLNPELIFKTRIKYGEGLVGLVGERGEPINLDRAPEHPNFHVIPDSGEEKFPAFLGVPLTHSRELMGVLTVQQEDPTQFDESEESFLITLCAQLSGIIAHAQVMGTLWETDVAPSSILREATYSGLPSAPGVGIGTAVAVFPLTDLDAVPERVAENIAEEEQLLDHAFAEAIKEISRLHEMMGSSLPDEELGLFEAYLHVLESNSFITKIKNVIQSGVWAQGALKNVITQYVNTFEEMDDSYLRERATDFRDLGQRILFHLQAQEKKTIQFPERTILIGEEVTPSVLAEVPEDRLVGVVSIKGSSNSHVAILARAMGIPVVMGVTGMPVAKCDECQIIIDGYYGQVYVNPSATVTEEFERLSREEKQLDSELEELRDLPAETLDGYVTSLYVNTGLMSDVGRSLSVGAEGVGLHRTEVPFMARDRFPTEEEQRIIYRQLLKAFSPRAVMMRTLDVGGDKPLPYFPIEEKNPFLGWRGIRITLDHPDIFLVQIRAMMRANQGFDNLQVMLPMVSTIAEVEEARRLFVQAHEELCDEGENVTMPAFGVMIEVPSAVYLSREIAKRVDFVSIGSNDLTQYILAVDRSNARVAGLYDPLHPAVLHAMMYVVSNVHKEGKRVSLCGELSGDPIAVPILIAMGFDALSLSAARLPRVKWVIRTFTMSKARKLLEEVLAMDDPIEIRGHMELALEDAGLGGLIRAGR
ncbi:MAG: phosphoenolpyruvate--protein phosphotransferase [Gammaproteobacteria bacterium]|nr:phosphoenolpyruvate--protein phosphotransferase [Gammaproteobacteria bacterium]